MGPNPKTSWLSNTNLATNVRMIGGNNGHDQPLNIDKGPFLIGNNYDSNVWVATSKCIPQHLVSLVTVSLRYS